MDEIIEIHSLAEFNGEHKEECLQDLSQSGAKDGAGINQVFYPTTPNMAYFKKEVKPGRPKTLEGYADYNYLILK